MQAKHLCLLVLYSFKESSPKKLRGCDDWHVQQYTGMLHSLMCPWAASDTESIMH